MKRAIVLLLFLLPTGRAEGWGKSGHEMVNRLAVRCLPDGLRDFYARHEKQLVAKAMEADEAKRRTGCEDVYHFIDLDAFGDPDHYPRSIEEGVRKHGFDEFLRAGLLPWRVKDMVGRLEAAWKEKDAARIVELSAWIGHYAGDAHVPLHATANYDGQLTGQDGLHERWESQMLDRFAAEIEPAAIEQLGKAALVEDPFEATFAVSRDSLTHVEGVLKADKNATAKEPLLKPGRDGKLPKQRSEGYYKDLYASQKDVAVSRAAKSATWAASLWLTAWTRAGKPVPE